MIGHPCSNWAISRRSMIRAYLKIEMWISKRYKPP